MHETLPSKSHEQNIPEEIEEKVVLLIKVSIYKKVSKNLNSCHQTDYHPDT